MLRLVGDTEEVIDSRHIVRITKRRKANTQWFVCKGAGLVLGTLGVIAWGVADYLTTDTHTSFSRIYHNPLETISQASTILASFSVRGTRLMTLSS